MNAVRFATSLGPLATPSGPVKIHAVFSDGMFLASTVGREDADVLRLWASMAGPDATLACSDELAAAGAASGWRVTAWTPALLDARLALVVSLSSSGRLRNFRDPAPVAALARAAARLVRVPITRDVHWTATVAQERRSTWLMTTSSGLTAYIGASPLDTHFDLFASETELAAYVSDLAAGDREAAALRSLTNVRHVAPAPELQRLVEDHLGVAVVPAPTRVTDGVLGPVEPAACWWLAGVLDALATLAAAPDLLDASGSLIDGNRRYHTHLHVLRREWVAEAP